ncbi:hypothetical protein ACEPAH_2649 [Sanghuangporus vaninii]
MLLTCDGEISIFYGLKASVPAPLPIAKTPDCKARNVTLAPLGPLGDVSSMMLHITAAAGRILIDTLIFR